MDNSNIRISRRYVKENSVYVCIPNHLAKKYDVSNNTSFLEFEDTGDGIKIVPITFVNKFS